MIEPEPNDFSQEAIISLILKNLTKNSSFERVMNDLFQLTKDEEDKILRINPYQMTNLDILKILSKSIGINNLFKIILSENSKMNSAKIKKEIPEIKEEKIDDEPKNLDIKKEKENDIVIKNDDYSFYKNGTTPEKFEANFIQDNIVVEIPINFVNEDENKMEVEEGETSLEENKNNLGIKSEVKSSKNTNKNAIIKKKALKTVTKISSPLNKRKKNKGGLSYHYTLNEGKLYKFSFVNFNQEGNIAYFSCSDFRCECDAEYDVKEKIFILEKGHTIPHDAHNYIMKMTDNDLQVFNYMKKNNINYSHLKAK